MERKDRKKVDKKTVVTVVIAVFAIAIIILGGVIAGHTAYLQACEAQITNCDNFDASSPNVLTYVYEDGRKSVDFSKICTVSKGATIAVEKIQDEDMTVSKGTGTVVDLSERSQRLAVVSVTSKNKTKHTDYKITLVPKSKLNNVVNFNLEDGTVETGDMTLHYSGDYVVGLPTASRSYTSLSGNTYTYDFLGWYTTEDFEEGTEIKSLEVGAEGNLNLYARFAASSNPVWRSCGKKNASGQELGFWYYTFGSYPQSAVADFNLNKNIRKYIELQHIGNGEYFSYTANGETATYYKYSPKSMPNITENGYSTNTYYVFKKEPIEWRALAAPVIQTQKLTGSQLLLAENILTGSAYSANDESFASKAYYLIMNYKPLQKALDIFLSDEQMRNLMNPDGLMKYTYDGDTMYGLEGSEKDDSKLMTTLLKFIGIKRDANYLRSTILAMDMFSSSEAALLGEQTMYRYKLTEAVFGGGPSDSYSDKVWALQYRDLINPSYGFDPDYRENDKYRQALVTDFAAANGVYVSTSPAYKGYGSWWLRGAGGDQGMQSGNSTIGYGYRDKRVAYVKYTGYVHAYGATNYNIVSGVRPTVKVNNIANIES